MSKRNLTDRLLKSLKPARPGQRIEIMDSDVPGFGVRVTDTGARTFVLVHRFPGSRHPTRRKLGTVGAISLADARQKARDWLGLIGQGKDPSEEEQRAHRDLQRLQANTFSAVADEYMRQVVVGRDPASPRQRKSAETDRVIRKVLNPLWGDRPIAGITRGEVLAAIEGIRDHGTAQMLAAHGIKGQARSRPAATQARNVLAQLRTMFSWAIERGTYGLEASPCDHLRAARIVGDKFSRDRFLDDDEIFALWRATDRVGYPYGPLYRVLLLTGLRLNEVADATWGEFNLSNNPLWTIPAERMKGRVGKARAHQVPITADVLAILNSLPRFKTGEYLFSTTYGARPTWVGTKVKDRLSQRMGVTLRALARRRGDDPRIVTLKPWTTHDTRRTVRSGLSRLHVDPDVAEAILAHVKPGIRGVYDRFDYLDEKRAALELWAARVRSIVEPPPANVIQLAARA